MVTAIMLITKRKLVLVAVIAIVLLTAVKRKPKSKVAAVEKSLNSDTQSLADRLKSANAICFGAEWCGFTKKQLAETQSLTGAYSYVDCETDKNKCKSAGINAYPTWVINGKKHEGFMTSKRLSDVC
tara:strand:+ start:535 stop:915 length:381 start_codon:yes stop_codon:yes gene_type:complete